MGVNSESTPLISENRSATDYIPPKDVSAKPDYTEDFKSEGQSFQENSVKNIEGDNGHKKREWILIANLLMVVFLTFCIDVSLLAYFTDMSLERGLGEAQVGIVYSSYDISRFIGASVLSYKVNEFTSPSYINEKKLITALALINLIIVGPVFSRKLSNYPARNMDHMSCVKETK